MSPGFLHKRFLTLAGVGAALATLAAPAMAQTTQAAAGISTAAEGKADTGDTAWMLISAALVMLMVPGLALFYAGMVRRKNVLGTMMHSMAALAIVGLEWVIVGYCMSFGTSQHHVIDWDSQLLFLRGVTPGMVHAVLDTVARQVTTAG